MKAQKTLGPRNSQSGQATIEYILLLVVVLTILGGSVYQFNTAFRNYTENFFDGYVGCLLETGELPGIGDCENEFQPFDIASGTERLMNLESSSEGPPDYVGSEPSDSGPNSQSSSGGSSGDQGDSRSGNADANSSGGRGEVLAGKGTNSDGTEGSTAVGSSFLKNRKAAVSEGKFGGSKDEAELAGLSPMTVAVAAGEFKSGDGKKTGLGGTFGYFGEEMDRDNENQRPKTAAASDKGDRSNKLKPKIAVENTDRAPAQVVKDDGFDFSIGNLLRWILIIGIGLIIAVFFGGQILQASKSYEK